MAITVKATPTRARIKRPAGRTTLQADNNEPNNGFSTAKLIKTDQDGKHRGVSRVSDLTIHNATDVDVFKVETVRKERARTLSTNTGEIGRPSAIAQVII